MQLQSLFIHDFRVQVVKTCLTEAKTTVKKEKKKKEFDEMSNNGKSYDEPK